MSGESIQQNAIGQEPVGFRFGLLDVMILITAAAIALWSHEFTLIFDTSIVPKSGFWKAVFRCNSVFTHTLGITGLLLFVKAIFSRETIFRDPGHWILYSFGFSSAILIAAGFYTELPEGINFVDLVRRPLPTEHLIGSIEQVLNVVIFISIVALPVYLVALLRNRGSWRIAFLCLSILVSLNIAIGFIIRFHFDELARRELEVTNRMSFLTTTTTALNTCSACIIAYCCATDRHFRSWKHWLGIAMLFHNWYATKALNYAAQSFGN